MIHKFGKEVIAEYVTLKLISLLGSHMETNLRQFALGLKKIILRGAEKDSKTIGKIDINH
jgi:hypothetical protein